ncbi:MULTISPECIES: hypothetical protein [Exiguobacterium]|uniref:hypothetical protein n=1 Tax=Exiguobacterium TaxID=33986 RepID=UPI00047930F7|nr:MULTISPECIES: hypothetical protein [Exiguobacterium]
MAHFIVQFPLKAEVFEQDVLHTRFEVGRGVFNSLANVTLKRYKEMIKTKRYRQAIVLYRSNKKEAGKILKALCKEYRLSEYEFHKDVKPMQHHFKRHIDSNTSQKIATQLWKGFDKLLYGNGNRIHFKKFGEFNSFEGKTNQAGIRFKDGRLLWNGLSLQVLIDPNNVYEVEAFTNDIAYCRIIRKWVRRTYKFYVQIVFKGSPPLKRNKETGQFKRTAGCGDVGLDIGPSTIAIVSAELVKLVVLADQVQRMEEEKRLLLRKMDRSRRAMNPTHFHANGTPNAVPHKKWIHSNHYASYRGKLRELHRKQAAVRKYQHECLANEIMALGDNIYVESMRFSGLARRAKETTVNARTGRFNKKKRFGKSIANRAPAMLLDIINRKLAYNGNSLIKIKTHLAKASQYNHLDKTFKKKKLSERWNDLNGIKVQRDLYSAFLIMNINDDLETYDEEKCTTRFDAFLIKHHMEINRCKKLRLI